MKVAVQISGIHYVNEIDTYWSNQDYQALLKLFDFPDADQVSPNELKEMLYMSITDFEPEEAAEIVLTYKLSEQLSKGQIQSVSHDMMGDKVAEEYPEPDLHFDLFNINQLLFKAYNGTFPNTEASVIEIELPNGLDEQIEMTEEIMTKIVSQGLSEKNLLNRLYADQLAGEAPFEDAAKFIWRLSKKDQNSYELLTSRYWIEKEDIRKTAYEAKVVFFEED